MRHALSGGRAGAQTEVTVSSRQVRSAFTLLELVVLIFVLGLLVALLLPAAQRARESARRVQCVSHLKQMMTACYNYNSVHGMFPPGNSMAISLHGAILPFLDQGALFEKIDYSVMDARGPENAVVRSVSIPVFICPSDPGHAVYLQSRGTNYAGNAGIGWQCNKVGGLFGLLSPHPLYPSGPVRERDVVDGLSNTAALSELLVANGIPEPLRTVWDVPVSLPKCKLLDEFADTCSTRDYSGQSGDRESRGRPWLAGDNLFTLYNHISPPNQLSCTNRTWVPGGTFPAVSLHPGGVNLALADGSVRFVTDSVDRSVWRALGTRNGREAVTLP